MTELITSRQNSRVKEAVKLRGARQRTKQGRFVIDGVREIERALAAGINCLEAFVCPSVGSTSLTSTLEKLPEKTFTAEVTAEVWEKLSFGERTDGIVIVAETPERKLEQLRLPEHPILAVLEGLEKPGNVGAILRSADGAGVDAVIVADPQTDLFNPNTIRASVGTVFNANICTASSEETLALLQEKQIPVVATLPDAEKLYSEVDYRQGAAIVLGSEAEGLSPIWQQAEIIKVKLPMQGIADSLNVSTTAAVLFYEALRAKSYPSSSQPCDGNDRRRGQ